MSYLLIYTSTLHTSPFKIYNAVLDFEPVDDLFTLIVALPVYGVPFASTLSDKNAVC